MILKNLRLHNFKQYPALQLNFQEGLIGIVGKNGSGKSSIFEGILLCLFGSSNSDKEFYKTSWVEKKENVLLELSFELNQKHFIVRREFRGKALAHQAQLFDQHDELIATGAKTVNEEVAKLIGMDKEAFTRSVFSGQKELGAISGTRGEERKRMVRKMIGLDNLDHIQKMIREDRNLIKKQIQFHEDTLLDKEDLAALTKEIKETSKNISASNKTLTKLDKLTEKALKKYQKAKLVFDEQFEKQKLFTAANQKLIKSEAALKTLTERLEEKKQSIVDLHNIKLTLKEKAPLIKAFEKKEKEKEALEKQKILFDKKLDLLKNLHRFQEKLTEWNQKITAYNTALSAVPKIQSAIKTQQTSLEKIQKEIAILRSTLAQKQSALGAVEARIADRKNNISNIESIGKDADCPTCLRPLIDVYDKTISLLQNDLIQFENKEKTQIKKEMESISHQLNSAITKEKKIQKELTASNTNLKLLQKQQTELEELQKRYKKGELHCKQTEHELKQYANISFDPNYFESLCLEISAFRNTYVNYLTQQKEIEKIPLLKEEQKILQGRIKDGKALIKNQKHIVTKLKFSEELFQQTKTQQETAEEEKNTAQKNASQQKDLLRGLQQKLKELQTQLAANEKIKENIASKKEEFHQLDELDGLYKAFKTFILEKVRPTISGEASQLFERITQGRYDSIFVDENFEFHIYENGIAYPITRFSGGEIDLANLCLRIGISKAIAEISGSNTPINFLAFDEIFGSQDEERRFGILHALELLKEEYRQIYIISHVDTIKEHFPKILEVRKSKTGSLTAWL